MFPTKTLLDFIADINRIHPKTSDEDMFQSPHAMPPSSSSTDTSPDSCLDLIALRIMEYPNRRHDEAQFPRELRPIHDYSYQLRSSDFGHDLESQRQDALENMRFENHDYNMKRYMPEQNEYNTPLSVKQECPIVGRKIVKRSQESPQTINKFPIWQPDLTPPKENIYTTYELFPSEKRSFKLLSPVKTPPPQLQRGFEVLSPVKTPPTQLQRDFEFLSPVKTTHKQPPQLQRGFEFLSPVKTTPTQLQMPSQCATSPRSQFRTSPRLQFGSSSPPLSQFETSPTQSSFGTSPTQSSFGTSPMQLQFSSRYQMEPPIPQFPSQLMRSSTPQFGSSSPLSQFGTSPTQSSFGTSPTQSPFGTSPTQLQFSSRYQMAPPIPQFSSQLMRSSTPHNTPFKEPMKYTKNNGPVKMCTFCKKNGETPLVYTTHAVKEKVGNKTVVTCPILRAHICSTCGVSGDSAHTISYCPVLRNGNNGHPLQSTTITLKNTRIKSNGRRRY